MKKIAVILGLILVFTLFAKESLQELENQLETLTGRKKIAALAELSEYYETIDPLKSFEYADEIINLSTSNEFHKERAIAHCLMGKYYIAQNNMNKAFHAFNAGLAVSEEKEFIMEIADCSYHLGLMHYQRNDFTKATDAFSKALEHYKLAENVEGEGNSLNYLGLLHWKWNKFSKALEYHQEALLIKEQLQDEEGIAQTLNYIGNVYIQLNNFDDALEHYNKSLLIYDKLNHQKGKADVFHSIGSIHKHQGDMDKSLDYFIRSLKIREELDEKLGIANCFNDIGTVHQTNQSYRLANDYFQQAEQIFQEQNELHGLALAKHNMAKNDFLQKQYNAAIQKVNESNDILEQIIAPQIQMNNLDLLSRIYAARGDFKTALNYFKSYDDLKDHFFKEELRKVTELKIDYETQRKDRQIDLLRKERQIIELQMEAQKANLRTMVIVLIFLFILLVVLIQRYWTHKKARQELTKQTEELKAVAKTDTLTKISNKNDLLENLEREKKRFARNQKSFVIMVADLDDFSRINEQYGKKAGDFVLHRFSAIIRSSIRRHDIIGRWGGQQFLMILPETDLQGGQIISEKIRKKIATNPVNYNGMNIYITVTIGLTIYSKEMDMEACVGKAEKALETGKNRGKNCVIITPA